MRSVREAAREAWGAGGCMHRACWGPRILGPGTSEGGGSPVSPRLWGPHTRILLHK